MSKKRTLIMMPLGALLITTACATRGQMRDVEAALAEHQAELDAERSERVAADERLAADLQALRSDLEAMRTDFDARIVAVEEGLQFTLPVHFAFDDASVQMEDQAALDRFAEIIGRHYTGAVVTVEGFADPAGPRAYNESLSERRAEAVREYLIGHGIQADVRSVGYGENRLVVPGAEKDDPGAELNRRVVFVVESPARGTAVTVLDDRG